MTRLNARLAPDLAAKLELLKRRTKKNVTEIVHESIELYYRQTSEGGATSSGEAFESSGFVGCADGEENLAADYKRLLADLIERKSGRS
jgi:hypothetical protein